ncbi:hypothetical protein ACVIWU_001011 [Bradyrhizobium sp. USDA 4509]|uniref:hypothetical protein n=1 Tax=Bradyrhizobium brasilense TaxID=1419277 RepID=UPI001E446A7B|nr:hypothetical protein [Bradyrhizobium brasilense]MCC8970122.1 hypothetical protein [Bradyrhizobium brasilense]
MNPEALRVTAALRLSEADSIGVPVFELGNSMYLPEMDADFNISAFLQFENYDGYHVTRLIPHSYIDRLFRVGDPAPIIFWYKKEPHIIEGDAERERLVGLFGVDARTNPVLRDLGGMLHDARTGKFKAQQEEWLAREIETSYNDVFLEAPSRTKYWISRYRAALENARKLTQPPHPIDVRLRRASSLWLERFATKAELPMVSAILGEASQGIYSIKQIGDIIFAYVSNRLSSANGTEIARLAEDETISSLLRGGMYNTYLYDGWPHVPFSYEKPDFIALMKERLVQGQERWSWRTANLLSKLLFGDREAPAEVDDIALLYMKRVVQRYDTLTSSVEYDFGGLSTGRVPEEMAKEVVARFEQATDLSCVMHGEDRINGRLQQPRFGLLHEEVDRYRRYLDSQP